MHSGQTFPHRRRGAISHRATEEGSSTGFWTSPRCPVGRPRRKPRAEGRGGGRSDLAKRVIPRSPEKPRRRAAQAPVPQTDTGGWVEHTEAIGSTMVKELDKMAP